MATEWLKSGLEKVSAFAQFGSDEIDDFSPIEFRSVCNHLGYNREGLEGAAEDLGLSKVAAVTALIEKLSVDPMTAAVLTGGIGAAGAKLYPKIRPYARALAQKILPRHAKRDIAVENMVKMLRGMPKGTQGDVIKEVMDTAKAGPTFGRSPLTWGRKDFLKALGYGGAGVGAGAVAGRATADKDRRKSVGNKVVVV